MITNDYDPEVDAMLTQSGDAPAADGEEAGPDVLLDYDARDAIVGLEALRFGAKRPPLRPGSRRADCPFRVGKRGKRRLRGSRARRVSGIHQGGPRY